MSMVPREPRDDAERATQEMAAAGFRMSQNIVQLLDAIGTKTTCKGCGKPIWFVRQRSGRLVPYTGEALNHFVDCPNAKEFRKG